MSGELLFCLLLGHLVGDYLAQTEWMAYNKHENTEEGWFAAIAHCTVYSVAVFAMLAVGGLSLGLIECFVFIWFIFNSHIIFDKTKFVMWWTTKVLGRTYDPSDTIKFNINTLVYVVADNTFHLLLMYFILGMFV